jgi:hypothetical protein
VGWGVYVVWVGRVSDTPAPTRREWVFAVALALLALLLSSLPYLVAARVTPGDQVYNGFVFDVDDGYSHLAKLQQGARGAWRFHLLFTSEPHEPIVTNLFYLTLGHLMNWLNVDLLPFYHSARLFSGFILLLVAYRFIAYFIAESEARQLAYFLAIFGSGLGWLVPLFTGELALNGLTPVEFWLIEMFTFFSLTLFTHFNVAVTCLLLLFLSALHYLEKGKWTSAMLAAGSALGLTTIHPYMVMVADGALGLYWLLHILRQRRSWWQPLAGLAVVTLAPLPLIALQYVGLRHNPVMAGWQAQNLTLSPPPLHYIVGYGVMLVLALIGTWWIWRRDVACRTAERLSRWPLLPIWLLVVAGLLYAPLVFDIQRRFIEGAHIPVAVLATAGLRYVVQPGVARSRFAGWLAARGYGRQRLAGLVGLLLVMLTLPSTVLLLAMGFTYATGDSPTLRFSENEIAAVSWIEKNSKLDDAIMSSYDVGGYIPAFTGRRSFMGHWTETVEVDLKRELASSLYRGDQGEELLRRYHIDYVFYGPHERAMGRALDSPLPYLQPVFSSGEVTLFRVEQ